jgi:quinol monooxygenase YgiN|tara:strand:- start:1971 stop:2264 length:294 start_codon:yes stop_codon:yes gene_type:complete
MSVLVTLELPAKAETLDEFMAVMRDTLLATRAYAGCEKVETYLEQNTSTLFLVEQWESAEHQVAYMGWRVETGLMDAIGGFLAGPPVARTFDPKSDI